MKLQTSLLQFKSECSCVIISSIFLVVSSNAVANRRDKSITYARTCIIALIICILISLNSLYYNFVAIDLEYFHYSFQINIIICVSLVIVLMWKIDKCLLNKKHLHYWKLKYLKDFLSMYKRSIKNIFRMKFSIYILYLILFVLGIYIFIYFSEPAYAMADEELPSTYEESARKERVNIAKCVKRMYDEGLDRDDSMLDTNRLKLKQELSAKIADSELKDLNFTNMAKSQKGDNTDPTNIQIASNQQENISDPTETQKFSDKKDSTGSVEKNSGDNQEKYNERWLRSGTKRYLEQGDHITSDSKKRKK